MPRCATRPYALGLTRGRTHEAGLAAPGRVFPLPSDRLAEALRAAAPGGLPLRLVFLMNDLPALDEDERERAQRVAEAFLIAGVGHVVLAMPYSNIDRASRGAARRARRSFTALNGCLGADSATAFAAAFHVALFSGRTVRDAFDSARSALRPDDSARYVLLPASGDTRFDPHEVHLFRDMSTTELTRAVTHPGSDADSVGFRDGSRLPAPLNLNDVDDVLRHRHLFQGRQEAMVKVMELLVGARVANLCGLNGVGKSALGAEVAMYLHARHYFPEGVYWINVPAPGASVLDMCQVVAEKVNGSPTVRTARMRTPSVRLPTLTFPCSPLVPHSSSEVLLTCSPRWPTATCCWCSTAAMGAAESRWVPAWRGSSRSSTSYGASTCCSCPRAAWRSCWRRSMHLALPCRPRRPRGRRL